MRIAIVGSRGIPNCYGGFEQFAEYLSIGLTKLGVNVTVYSPHFHKFQESQFNSVSIIHKWCPESILGASAHFFYDYLSIKDALGKDFDIIYSLGYGTSSMSYLLLPINKKILVTNMDGLEWKRDKWSPFVKRLTKWFEKIGALKSHYLISDNSGIQDYIQNTYKKNSYMIPYGADAIKPPSNQHVLDEFNLDPNEYFVLIARLEPENNIEMILDGFISSKSTVPFIVIGNSSTKYGSILQEKYKNTVISFIGTVYDIHKLNDIRFYSKAYFHGHSVGGTNPSLLEAMASHTFIFAHDNKFNKSVLEDAAYYFNSDSDVEHLIMSFNQISENKETMINLNLKKINSTYNWKFIIKQYYQLFKNICQKGTHFN